MNQKDIKTSKETVLSVPLTTLPAILGRNSTNEHTFELGNCKQLSRKHCEIFFADKHGGRIGKSKTNEDDEDKAMKIDGDWSYTPHANRRKNDAAKEEFNFAIKCLSKNKIIVDGERVEQGQTTILKHGSTIKLLTFTLYFLLPKVEFKTFMVPIEKEEDTNSDHEPATHAPKRQKKEKDSQLFEQRPLPELIAEFLHAVETDNFERKHSMISTGILQYAVHDAANNPELRAQSDKEGGVSRTVLMDWIESNEVYRKYVNALLTKLEMKSYQQNLSRSLIKANYKRLGTTGRHIKWLLPSVDNVDEDSGAGEPCTGVQSHGDFLHEKDGASPVASSIVHDNLLENDTEIRNEVEQDEDTQHCDAPLEKINPSKSEKELDNSVEVDDIQEGTIDNEVDPQKGSSQ